jgi:deoxyribose-phosphate aldolase
MNLASIIEHTLLRPDCTQRGVEKICAEAQQFNFAGVCIPPYFVREARQFLGEETLKVVTVIGFPMGYSNTAAKVEEIKRALDEGADELDVVVNICAIKNANWNFVHNDIDAMTRAVHLKGKTIKIIIESALLSEGEIVRVCQMCGEIGVNFVKTSTGYHGGATIDAIRIMRANLPPAVKIKASGGIRTAEDAEKMVAAGANRIGTSSGPQIIGA